MRQCIKWVSIFVMSIGINLMVVNVAEAGITDVYDQAVASELMNTWGTIQQQLTQLENQTNYLQTALSSLKPGQYQWSNAQNLINQLGNVVAQTNSLAYSAQTVNQQFQQQYPGYQPPQDYNQQYQQNINTTISTLNGVLQSMGMSAQDFTNENARLTFLQQQAQNAQGQTQAIQAASQIASEQVTQLQLLRQTVIAQTNAQTAYFATQAQNDASAKAELHQVINSGATTAPAIGHSGQTISLPND